MAVKMSRIMEAMEAVAPAHLAEEWDNVGLLLGREDREISGALIALDVLDEIIDEALKLGANAIITHHPAIFSPINRINDASAAGRRLLRLIESKICVYSAHTNLDVAVGGINDVLFDTLSLVNKQHICEGKPGVFAGRAGFLQAPMTLAEFAKHTRRCLELKTISYCGAADAPVGKVGMVAGSSANIEFFTAAKATGCDTFVTSDIKFSMAQAAADMKLNLIDATHYASENIFANSLKRRLEALLPGLKLYVSDVDGQVFNTVSITEG